MTVAKLEAVWERVNSTQIVHIEDPARRGVPLCGAEVQGCYTTEPAECLVCIDLWLHRNNLTFRSGM